MCESRIISYKVFGRSPTSETVSVGPRSCETIIEYNPLPTWDKHGQDFEPIQCNKECVLIDLHNHHICKEHAVDSAIKFIKAGSDEVVPEWRNMYPAWALEQADAEVKE